MISAPAIRPQFKLIVEQVLESKSLDEAQARAAELRDSGNVVKVLPVLPRGLSRKELDAIVKEVGVELFRPGAVELLSRLNAINTELLSFDEDNEFVNIGAAKVYEVDGETYEDAKEALLAAGYVIEEDGSVSCAEDEDSDEMWTFANSVEEAIEELASEDEIEVRPSDEGQWPPMWSTVWSTDWLPNASGKYELGAGYEKRAVEVAEYTGVNIYSSSESDLFYIGVDGAGYSFYEEHWIPLAYLWGLYSN